MQVEELDVRGMRCPMPLLKTRQALRYLADGQLLRVLTDDPGSVNDIPRWLQENRHHLVGLRQDDAGSVLLIRKAG